MNPPVVNVQVDFFYDTFRSGVIEMPWELWHFDRKSKELAYIYLAEQKVYSYAKEAICTWANMNSTYKGKRDLSKIKLIQLKKLT